MISKELINYSLLNLKSRPGRSLLTILSIFIGITTIFIFISFGWGLYDYVDEMSSSSSADKVIIQPKSNAAPGLDDTFALTEDDLDAVKNSLGVLEATGVYFKVAEIEYKDERRYTFLVGYDPKEPLIIDIFNIGVEEGRLLRNGEKGKVLMGHSYLKEDKVFSRALEINDEIDVYEEEMKIVGFFEEVGSPPDDAQIYVTNEYLKEIYPNDSEKYGWIVARVNTDEMEKTIENIERGLRKSRNVDVGQEDFFVQSFEELIESYSGALNVVLGFVILIALISVIVSAINTANTMVTSVLERIKEIGVIKSIGAKNSEIFKIFLFESSFLGFVGGMMGVALGWILSYGGGIILSELGWGFLSPHFSPYLFGGCVAFAIITGAISGVAPAYQASRTNVVDALRYE